MRLGCTRHEANRGRETARRCKEDGDFYTVTGKVTVTMAESIEYQIISIRHKLHTEPSGPTKPTNSPASSLSILPSLIS